MMGKISEVKFEKFQVLAVINRGFIILVTNLEVFKIIGIIHSTHKSFKMNSLVSTQYLQSPLRSA
jgi:hypothetical protein